MAEISFDEEPIARPVGTMGPSGMAGWMVRKGFAKDEKGANTLLISIVVGSVAIAGLTLAFMGGTDTTVDSAERARLEASTPLPR